jgi:NAD(P)-dependent dehydrogenase (short-subunit alcohol dehydrogenase family)
MMQAATQASRALATYPSLAGKRVIITGGGSAIGAGIWSKAFVRQGAHVALSTFWRMRASHWSSVWPTSVRARSLRQDVTDFATLKDGITG